MNIKMYEGGITYSNHFLFEFNVHGHLQEFFQGGQILKGF